MCIPVDPDLKVQVGAGGLAGRADVGNHIPLVYMLSSADSQGGCVGIQSGVPAAVVDDHVIAVAPMGGSGNHCAGSGGVNGSAVAAACGDVNAGMEGAPAGTVTGGNIIPAVCRADKSTIRKGRRLAAVCGLLLFLIFFLEPFDLRLDFRFNLFLLGDFCGGVLLKLLFLQLHVLHGRFAFGVSGFQLLV